MSSHKSLPLKKISSTPNPKPWSSGIWINILAQFHSDLLRGNVLVRRRDVQQYLQKAAAWWEPGLRKWNSKLGSLMKK